MTLKLVHDSVADELACHEHAGLQRMLRCSRILNLHSASTFFIGWLRPLAHGFEHFEHLQTAAAVGMGLQPVSHITAFDGVCN